MGGGLHKQILGAQKLFFFEFENVDQKKGVHCKIRRNLGKDQKEKKKVFISKNTRLFTNSAGPHLKNVLISTKFEVKTKKNLKKRSSSQNMRGFF